MAAIFRTSFLSVLPGARDDVLLLSSPFPTTTTKARRRRARNTGVPETPSKGEQKSKREDSKREDYVITKG